MSIYKKIVFLEMSPNGPNKHHIEILKNNDKCDFFYVTFKKPVENDDSFLGFFPNTVWGETRQKLFELVPKKYDSSKSPTLSIHPCLESSTITDDDDDDEWFGPLI